MTKLRTAEECLNALQAESAWRKKEISSLRSAIDALAGAGHETLIRSAVLIIYAHWEGFVKRACEYYIRHINERISRHDVSLTDHFHSVLMWQEFRKRGDHQFLKNPVPFIESTRSFFLLRTNKDLLTSDVVDAESNLNSRVLKKLIIIVDIDYSLFETKEKLIDDNLLFKRNRIAHGERVMVKSDEYIIIEEEVRELIDVFQKAIEDCVQQEKYKSPASKYLGLK